MQRAGVFTSNTFTTIGQVLPTSHPRERCRGGDLLWEHGSWQKMS